MESKLARVLKTNSSNAETVKKKIKFSSLPEYPECVRTLIDTY